MSVFRIHHESEYTVISNTVIRDNNLSLKTLGLFVKMLSLPPDWDFSIKGLAAISKDGESAVNNALKEMEEFGYLVRNRVYERGKIVDINYDLYECPSLKQKNLNCENLNQENLNQENPVNKINNKLNKEYNKKEDSDKNLKESVDLTDEEFYNKYKNKKDIRTLMIWTNRIIKNKDTADALVNWLKLMLANNKWQTLELYNNKLADLFDKKGNLNAIDIIKDATDKNYFSFVYSIDYLNRGKKSKPSYQYDKKDKTNKQFGVDRKIDISTDEIF